MSAFKLDPKKNYKIDLPEGFPFGKMFRSWLIYNGHEVTIGNVTQYHVNGRANRTATEVVYALWKLFNRE